MNDIPVEIDIELLQPEDVAPAFELKSFDGTEVSFPVKDRWTILWWYPQAMGMGCAQCADAFRKHYGLLKSRGADLIGLTFSTPAANEEFAKRLKLSFPLLQADEELASKYGAKRSAEEAWERLPRRIVYLVDKGGIVRKRYLITGDPGPTVARVYEDLLEEQASDDALREPEEEKVQPPEYVDPNTEYIEKREPEEEYVPEPPEVLKAKLAAQPLHRKVKRWMKSVR